MTSYKFIDSASDLLEMLGDLTEHPGAIALDAERASGFKYSQRAYLLQLRTSESIAYLLDTPALIENASNVFSQFQTWLSSREWILHAATQDLPCLMELDIYPQQIFDTEVAARILGLEKVGLAALVEHYLEITLAKEHSAADWSQRPLTDSMLEYAALDVEHLFTLRDKLQGDLEAAEKTEIISQEFNHLLKFRPKPRAEQPWRGTGGIHAINNRQQLAIVRELWEERERIAIAEDISPGRIVPDRSLVHAAAQRYVSKRDMITDKSFNGRGATKYAQNLFDAYKRAAVAEPPELRMSREGVTPNHKSWEKIRPQAHQTLILLRKQLTEFSEQLSIPIEHLINPQVLRDIVWEGPENVSTAMANMGVRPWQQELVLPLFAAVPSD